MRHIDITFKTPPPEADMQALIDLLIKTGANFHIYNEDKKKHKLENLDLKLKKEG